MPHFLYRIQPTRLAMLSEGPTPQEAATVDAHFGYLQRLVAEGTVVLAGRTLLTDERTFGVVLLVAATEAEAQAVVRADPAVAHGVMRAELFPFRVALWATTTPDTP